VFIDRFDNRHTLEKRFSHLPPEERRAKAEGLVETARHLIERQKIIEGRASEVQSGSARKR
jgi:hypothetical protein